mmetsp:Transcript_8060/g.35863  ORF Transcript_8060/g.35863 Transcript_8060/m.35863 type:complete len:98 (-) Transcript_8060:629-922(-)
MMEPKQPNILVTGTPGVGKTTLATKLAEQESMKFVDVGKYAINNRLTDGYDDERACHVLDEDKVREGLPSRHSGVADLFFLTQTRFLDFRSLTLWRI